MTDYIVSARKYRPATFKTVVGQKHLTATLKNAIDQNKLAQAYLFCGPRGVGKTSCARIFAKTINCLNPTSEGEACGQCESCISIEKGNSFNIIELDAASNNSVDDIRKLTEEVNIPPQVGDFKVFIIDEVHMLSTSAFNAFLKTLEEPPRYAIFILATTEKHKVIPTILSRCQIYDFKRITTSDIVEHLQYVSQQEGIEASSDALNVIARKADGAMRDALSIFDQVAASSFGKITYQSALANLNVLDYEYYFRLIDAFRAGDAGAALLIYNEILERGFDNLFFINGLSSHIRDLLVAADARTAKLLEVAEDVVGKYSEQAHSLPLQWYFAALKIVNDTDFNYRTATNKQILIELMLIRLCQLLNPPQAPFDRVDNEPPLKMPYPVATDINPSSYGVKKSTDNKDNPTDTVSPKKAPEDVKTEVPEKQTSSSNTPKPETKTARKSGRKSTRLSDLEEAYNEEHAKVKDRKKEVDPVKLLEVWNEFIAANPEKSILVSAMKESAPTLIGIDEYLIKVVHPAQEQAFHANMSKLLKFVRDSLENDFISFKMEIDDNIEIKKPMPAKELFQDIIKGNASIANLARNLDVEII